MQIAWWNVKRKRRRPRWGNNTHKRKREQGRETLDENCPPLSCCLKEIRSLFFPAAALSFAFLTLGPVGSWKYEVKKERRRNVYQQLVAKSRRLPSLRNVVISFHGHAPRILHIHSCTIAEFVLLVTISRKLRARADSTKCWKFCGNRAPDSLLRLLPPGENDKLTMTRGGQRCELFQRNNFSNNLFSAHFAKDGKHAPNVYTMTMLLISCRILESYDFTKLESKYRPWQWDACMAAETSNLTLHRPMHKF